ncbi:thioesterase II family protein [Streptomyces sp. NBC_00572]|uniref:thioesterase II family protein n=1 Tax=Streptomyces sp. NBC_00572 TaxID=2903664 RepID=UPI0022549DF4|nr:alpha/beta fold hydrolase [Streptomyces sp. NBC_00572]MCX4987066.1 alpha/beta fold hydrolase [Streptomyces sp. NBC_00572]
MDSTWFRRFGAAREGAVRLVCFPHAGGAASAFIPLSRALGEHVDVLAVQYPGRQDRRREEPYRSVDAHADALAEAMGPLTDEPYAFFGHSMGAVLAYETAHRLVAAGRPGPCRVFLSGRGAPSPLPSPHDRLGSDTEILRAVRGLGGTGHAVLDDPELLAMVMPALRADYGALGTYRWSGGAPLAAPVTVLIGDADPVVAVDEAAAWHDHTSGDFDLRILPGGHFYLDDRTDEVRDIITDGLLVAGSTA